MHDNRYRTDSGRPHHHAPRPPLWPRRRTGRACGTAAASAATAIYNALSATFPTGEAFFVDSVRAFRDGAPPKLAEEIKAFTTQEVIHSREHLAFNRRAADAGYDLSKLEAAGRTSAWRSPSRSRRSSASPRPWRSSISPPSSRTSCSLNPRHLAGADGDAAELWRWHACEEIEHKGVAYDTWLHATRTWPRSKRWKVKAKVMLFVTRNFIVDRTAGALELMRQDGVDGPQAWSRLLWYVWVRPGMFRKIAGAWFNFFLPGFHPWNEDDRHLLVRYDADAKEAPEPKRKVRRAA